MPAKPGMIIKAQVPCGGSVMRVKMTDQGADGIYPHEKMEVYAMGFRNQAGVAFGPNGTKWANALAVTDNGANDLGHRRIANGAGEALHRDREGAGCRLPRQGRLRTSSPTSASPGKPTAAIRSTGRLPQLYIGDKPFVPKPPVPTTSSSTSTASAACR